MGYHNNTEGVERSIQLYLRNQWSQNEFDLGSTDPPHSCTMERKGMGCWIGIQIKN
jgi:hypothetical protein